MGFLANEADLRSGTEDMEDRIRLIRTASWIAIGGNFMLAAMKIIVGLIAGSLAVLSDGIDSSTDVLIALMTLLAAGISAKPSDKEHPYGHGRIETVASAVIAFIVFFAGGQVFVSALTAIFSNEPASMPSSLALWVTGVSIAGKLALAYSQFYLGKKSNSAMLIANAKNMRGDVMTSAGVLIGLGLTFLTGIPVVDKVLAMLVALWIIKNAIGIFLEANTELMDGTTDHGPYRDLFKAVSEVPLAGNPHRVRLRRIGSMFVADMDIEVDPNMTVKEAHEISQQVETSIKQALPEIYDVIVHVEPHGNVEDEKFGLTSKDTH